uniref:Uncharacterized protein n=1 Tax=Glossina palpalis gambiensis TaxID=67801 RepID=A0A1B0B1T2_9MUSC
MAKCGDLDLRRQAGRARLERSSKIINNICLYTFGGFIKATIVKLNTVLSELCHDDDNDDNDNNDDNDDNDDDGDDDNDDNVNDEDDDDDDDDDLDDNDDDDAFGDGHAPFFLVWYSLSLSLRATTAQQMENLWEKLAAHLNSIAGFSRNAEKCKGRSVSNYVKEGFKKIKSFQPLKH